MEVCDRCGILIRKNAEKKAWESFDTGKVYCRTGGPHVPEVLKAQVDWDAFNEPEPTEAELIDWSNWETELDNWTKE